jgi:hypothetical protein
MNIVGMTLKQYARFRFFRLLDLYRVVKKSGLKTDEDKQAFLLLSLQIHQAKGQVPKYLWPLVNK